jgi:drug/metabolite transporter (DMT)-like permease
LLTGQRPSAAVLKGQGVLLFLSGAALGANWILLFEAYKYTTVSTATLCYYFAPVIVTVVSLLLFREKISLRQGVCFAMSTLGLAMIVGFGDLHVSGRGILLGLGAAVLYASVVLLNKAIRGVDGLMRTFFQFSAAGIVLLPYVLLTGGFHLVSLDGGAWAMLLTVGLVHTGVAYCLYFSSVAKLSGRQAAVLSYVDPLTAVLVSVFILSEGISPLQILGGAMILGFSLASEWKKK